MTITHASVELQSRYHYQSRLQHSRIQLANGRPIPQPQAAEQQAEPERLPLATKIPLFSALPCATANAEDLLSLPLQDSRLRLLKAILEYLTGRPIALASDLPALGQSSSKNSTSISAEQTTVASMHRSSFDTPPIITISLDLLQESEYSSVDIEAVFSRDGGPPIGVRLSVEMQRHYQQDSLQLLRQRGLLTDPLVINFNADSARLGPQLTSFDLDGDGQLQNIASLISDSAYLALDKNGNGIIDNGSELFGPASGDGFVELAQYDEDSNGFIDDGDSVYRQLQLYRPGDGFQQSLHDMQIDALYLDAVDSPFRLTDNQNRTLGQVRNSSFYIDHENRAGSIQQIDLMS